MPPLDPEVREDLEHILRINRNRIITLYAHFVSSLCDCLVDKGVSVHRLRTFLLKMPAFERGDDKQCQAKLLSGVKSKLEEADTVYKIFDLLGEECASFLNYDIYRSIQDKFCSDVDCDDFKYPEYLKAYIEQHKLKEFFDVNPKLEKLTKASKKLKLKMDIELTSKVARVINLKSSLAALLGLRPSALRLFSIEEGCVLVTFLIPATVAGSVFPADKKVDAQQMEGFRSLSVLWATCGDFHMDFRDSASLSSLLSWPEHPQAEATGDYLITVNSIYTGNHVESGCFVCLQKIQYPLIKTLSVCACIYEFHTLFCGAFELVDFLPKFMGKSQNNAHHSFWIQSGSQSP